MRHRFVILSMVLFVLFRPTSMFAQAGRALLQQSHRAQLGPGPLPSDVVLAGQIEDGRASKPFRMIVTQDKARYDIGESTMVFGPGGGWTRLSNGFQILPAHAASRRPDILPLLDLLSTGDSATSFSFEI